MLPLCHQHFLRYVDVRPPAAARQSRADASIPKLETAEYIEKVRAMPEGSYVYIGAQVPRADRPIHIKASLNAASTAPTTSAWSRSLPFIASTNQSAPLVLASVTSGRGWLQATRINRLGEALGGTQERPYHLLVTYAAQQLGAAAIEPCTGAGCRYSAGRRQCHPGRHTSGSE